MASWRMGKRGSKPEKSGMGGRPAAGPNNASSTRQMRSAANPAAPICRNAVNRGTSRPARISTTMTPIDPTNQMVAINH